MGRPCCCGKGYASDIDNRCRNCREHQYTRAEAKSVGVKHRGDGMTLDQEAKLLRKKCGMWL